MAGALDRTGFDRIPVRYYAEPPVNTMLMDYFGISTKEELCRALGVDLRYVQPIYCGPEPQTFPDGSRTLVYPDRGWPVPTRYKDFAYSGGTYTEATYRPFANIKDPSELDLFDFPTADWLDYSSIRQECETLSEFAIVTGTPGMLDFINGIGHSRGIEQVFMDIALADPVYLALMEKKYQYHYEMIERTLQAARGRIDIVQTGEDLGSQEGLLISPRKFDELLAPLHKEFNAMVHRYEARTMMHCCGSCRDLIPRLIEIGLDILDVVQTAAARMDIKELHDEFGRELSFCGTVCVQSILPHLTVEKVIEEVERRLELFHDGGLILGPSHLIQPGTPIENILAMYQAAGSIGK